MCIISHDFCREHKAQLVWLFAPPESYRLTEQDITDFVNCIKEYVFISIFNKTYTQEAAEACQYLSILRPELIVPAIVEKFDTSNAPFFVVHSFYYNSFLGTSCL